MPIYFDLHAPGDVASPVLSQGVEDAGSGAEDRHHVRQVDYYCADDGVIYCVLEAPSADDVRARHAERGMSCGEVYTMTQVNWHLPLSTETRQELDHAIQRDWEARQQAV